jgi:hypothetical protein
MTTVRNRDDYYSQESTTLDPGIRKTRLYTYISVPVLHVLYSTCLEAPSEMAKVTPGQGLDTSWALPLSRVDNQLP